ncbi:hypothetical protein [Armatimonas rosea]|uniref:Uncharacterized protein n=1 Tax=Armatimonas rosea TaxID=685828 RepID=A0A7W9W645_ARMRO|nr:hypothetical protein [Armatimonas rosea]MBB6049202.1 hypothetical protein [Armatimonas rosea]
MREALKIIALTVGLSCAYGIVHDQITARVCLEYFTVGHFSPTNIPWTPTVLGLYWGIVATWWVGLILGLPLALCAQVGPWPKRSARELLRPLIILLLVTFACAMTGLLITRLMNFTAPPHVLPMVLNADQGARFSADLVTHNISYGVGLFGGPWLSSWVLRQRHLKARAGSPL